LEQQQLAAFFGGIFTVIEVLIFAPVILVSWVSMAFALYIIIYAIVGWFRG
jgi:hypothetical protein